MKASVDLILGGQKVPEEAPKAKNDDVKPVEVPPNNNKIAGIFHSIFFYTCFTVSFKYLEFKPLIIKNNLTSKPTTTSVNKIFVSFNIFVICRCFLDSPLLINEESNNGKCFSFIVLLQFHVYRFCCFSCLKR